MIFDLFFLNWTRHNKIAVTETKSNTAMQTPTIIRGNVDFSEISDVSASIDLHMYIRMTVQ